MKKTLLTLALAGLSATAFANVNLYQSNNALLYVNGSAFAVYDATKSKSTYATGEYGRIHKHVDYVRFRLGFGGLYATNDSFRFGFDARWQVNGSKVWGSNVAYNQEVGKGGTYVTTKNYDVKGAKPFSWKTDDYNRLATLNRFYAYAAHKDFGKLTVGRNVSSVLGVPTVSFENYVTTNAGRVNAGNVFQNQVVYTSPEVEGVKALYSFGNAHKGELGNSNYDYVRNNAWGLQTTVADTTVTGVASWQKSYNQGYLVHKDNLFQVNAANKSVKDLTVALTYTYEKARDYAGLAAETPTTKTVYQTVAAGVNYTGFQYVQPYAGASFRYTKNFNADKTLNTRAKTVTAYVGFNSDLVKTKAANVSYYAEAYATRNVTRNPSYVNSTLTNLKGLGLSKVTTKAYGVSTGLTVSF